MRKWLADYEDMDKDARVNLRLPKALVLEFKRKADARRIPYQRLMRAVLQEAAKSQ
jgi:predicted DNA binding CopG/RHH family protein